MMIGETLVIEAVVPFSAISSSGIEPASYRISLSGSTDVQVSALVRLRRQPMSETDVVEARGEIATRVAVVFFRWELRQRHDDILLAGAHMAPIAVRRFAPLPCLVRLFGSGTAARLALREG